MDFRNDDFEFEMINDSTLNDTITGLCEFVDTGIQDVTNNKTNLASTMDIVISLMREVESKERAAEQAKAETARSGLDILAKVDEVKQAQQRAKETNDMHSKEMQAQQAVLATEIEKLQSRVSGLLTKGGRSLGVLDEIRRALENRLSSALKEKESADKEKLEKESVAQKALAFEERQLEMMVEETERLKQEGIKNSKLQQFLVDRGHVVDMLDGDVSDKCKDVNLLKESLDQAVMLSGVLSSSQTSSTIASSISSLTTEILKEKNEPVDSGVVLKKSFGFGLDDFTNDHVQSATQKHIESGELVTLVASPEHQSSSKISNLDLEKQGGNKNVVFEVDVKDEHALANITEGGHAMSTEESSGVLSSRQTPSIIPTSSSSLTTEIPKEKSEPVDSGVVLNKSLGFGLDDFTKDHVQSATQKHIESGELVTLVASPEHQSSSMISNLDLEKEGGNKNVAYKVDVKDEHALANITGEGHAMSTEESSGVLLSSQTPSIRPTPCSSITNEIPTERDKPADSSNVFLEKGFVFGLGHSTDCHASVHAYPEGATLQSTMKKMVRYRWQKEKNLYSGRRTVPRRITSA